MKKMIPFFLAFWAFSSLFAQKNSLTFGGGYHDYVGDLGSNFLKKDEERYGYFRLDATRFLTRTLDLTTFASLGEIGKCTEGPFSPSIEVPIMMNSRITTVALGLKIKLADGRFLSETSRIQPYFLIGAAGNRLRDVWTKSRVNAGFYGSLVGGAGFSVRISERYFATWSLTSSYFLRDDLDFNVGGPSDWVLQNGLTVGRRF